MLPSFSDLIPSAVDACKDAILTHMRRQLQADLQLDKVYMIRSRPSVLAFRKYLGVQRTSHRRVLTKFILSDHDLAVERLRWYNIPRHLRLCRMCQSEVETHEHVMFGCLLVHPPHSLGFTLRLRIVGARVTQSPIDMFHAALTSKELDTLAHLAYVTPVYPVNCL